MSRSVDIEEEDLYRMNCVNNVYSTIVLHPIMCYSVFGLNWVFVT